MLEYYASRIELSPDVDLSAYAALTSGLTGADVANLLNLAAIRAASNGQQQVKRQKDRQIETETETETETDGDRGS